MNIDWDNLPICGEPPVLVISPHICVMPPGAPPFNPPVVPPLPPVEPPPCDKLLRQRDFFTEGGGRPDCGVEPPPSTVPVPSTLMLCLLVLAMIAWWKR